MQVNAEPQKKAEEITAEVAIALTLSQLHPEAGGLDSSEMLSHGCSVLCFLAWLIAKYDTC